MVQIITSHHSTTKSLKIMIFKIKSTNLDLTWLTPPPLTKLSHEKKKGRDKKTSFLDGRQRHRQWTPLLVCMCFQVSLFLLGIVWLKRVKLNNYIKQPQCRGLGRSTNAENTRSSGSIKNGVCHGWCIDEWYFHYAPWIEKKLLSWTGPAQ